MFPSTYSSLHSLFLLLLITVFAIYIITIGSLCDTPLLPFLFKSLLSINSSLKSTHAPRCSYVCFLRKFLQIPMTVQTVPYHYRISSSSKLVSTLLFLHVYEEERISLPPSLPVRLRSLPRLHTRPCITNNLTRGYTFSSVLCKGRVSYLLTKGEIKGEPKSNLMQISKVSTRVKLK